MQSMRRPNSQTQSWPPPCGQVSCCIENCPLLIFEWSLARVGVEALSSSSSASSLPQPSTREPLKRRSLTRSRGRSKARTSTKGRSRSRERSASRKRQKSSSSRRQSTKAKSSSRSRSRSHKAEDQTSGISELIWRRSHFKRHAFFAEEFEGMHPQEVANLASAAIDANDAHSALLALNHLIGIRWSKAYFS